MVYSKQYLCVYITVTHKYMHTYIDAYRHRCIHAYIQIHTYIHTYIHTVGRTARANEHLRTGLAYGPQQDRIHPAGDPGKPGHQRPDPPAARRNTHVSQRWQGVRIRWEDRGDDDDNVSYLRYIRTYTYIHTVHIYVIYTVHTYSKF